MDRTCGKFSEHAVPHDPSRPLRSRDAGGGLSRLAQGDIRATGQGTAEPAHSEIATAFASAL